MIEQGNRTQQLIYRTSYRKHRERLADVRPNITANEFLPPKQSKKPVFKDKMKKEELESDNVFLRTKINAIKNRNSSKLQQLFSSEQVKKQSKRYYGQGYQTKLQIITDLNDGENIKFVLPSSKHNSFTFNVRSKNPKKHEITPMVSKGNPIQKYYKKYTSFSLLKDSQKDLKANKQKLDTSSCLQKDFDLKFNAIMPTGAITYKSKIADSRLYDGSGERNIKRTNQILKEYEDNYEELCNQIVIDKVNDKYLAIRIMPKEEEKQIIVSEEEKNKQRVKIQTQFLKRNFYTLGKNQSELKSQSQKQKVSNGSFQQVQAVVDRLTAPKRQFKLRQFEKAQRQRGFSDYQKLHKNNDYSHDQLTPFKKIESSNDKHETPLNKLKQIEPIGITNNQKTEFNPNTAARQKQEDKNEQQQYQEEFDNPSELKLNKHPLQQANLINASPLSKKSSNEKMKQSSIKNESSAQNNQFQKQQYNQDFEQSKVSPPLVQKEAKPMKPAEQVQEQYEQQFGN